MSPKQKPNINRYGYTNYDKKWYKQQEEQQRQEEVRRRDEANEQWRRDRPPREEYDRIRREIMETGLDSTIWFNITPEGGLLEIYVEPDITFKHLANENALQEAEREGNHYHVSICFESDIREEWQKQAVRHLETKYAYPLPHRFKIKSFGSGGSANIDHKDSVFQDVIGLHKAGSYYFKQIHISM